MDSVIGTIAQQLAEATRDHRDGKLDQAALRYEQILAADRSNFDALHLFGVLNGQRNQLAKAAVLIRDAIKINDRVASAHYHLAVVLARMGHHGAALSYNRAALALDPNMVGARTALSLNLSSIAPLWHVPMMNDVLRNDAYYEALRSVVTPQSHVLDIGAGSGLLSMMAAKLGARKVTSCEMVPQIAETAGRVIAANGLSERVSVIAKSSAALSLDSDDRADIIVSEIFSSEFLGEGVLASIEDARRRLLRPGGVIIPGRGHIRFALFGGEALARSFRVERYRDFDLSGFNAIVARKQSIAPGATAIDLLSAPQDAFTFDFMGARSVFPPERTEMDVPVTASGRCLGIVQWIRLQMTDQIGFENHPCDRAGPSGWTNTVYLFDEPVAVRSGETLRGDAAHDRESLWLSLTTR